MAYPPHALVALVGDWNHPTAASEVWQFGVRVYTGEAAGGHLADPQAYADDIGPAIGSWFGDASTHMAVYARLRQVKVNNIQPDGTYADPVTHLHDFGGGVLGGGIPATSQIMSVAWSWTTDAASRGHASHGRVYPPNAADFGSNGPFLISDAMADSHVAAAKALLTILLRNETAPPGHLVEPAIVSAHGEVNLIDHVHVDTLIDVQRRRKNRIKGTVHASNFP